MGCAGPENGKDEHHDSIITVTMSILMGLAGPEDPRDLTGD